MRLDDLPESDNIEDRRGESGGYSQGGGFGIPIGGRGGLGIGTIVVLGLIGYAFGIDPSVLIGGAEILSGGGNAPSYQSPAQPQRQTSRPADETGRFVSRVLGSTEVQWTKILAAQNRTYQRPRLVLFNIQTDSACGAAQRAMGPFYCPNDREIYLDTSFFEELQTRFRGCGGKACQFAEAYVIAHEVGHHVQNLLGILPKVQQAQHAMNTSSRNAMQVRVELQADCFGGVWAHHAEEQWKFIEPGDVEAALQTASAIGDDRLQRAARGTVVPDSFTHGTSEQRSRWFSIGLKNGTLAACDTFNAAQL